MIDVIDENDNEAIVVAVTLATAAVGCKSQADKCLDSKIECIEVKCRAETKGEGPMPADTLRDQLADCSGLVCTLINRVDRQLLDAAPNLQFVSSMSVGVDHIDLPLLTGHRA